MSSDIFSNHQIYVRTPAEINDLYGQLIYELGKTCLPDPATEVATEVAITSRAGDFYVTCEAAWQQYDQLVEWDRADTVDHHANGKISERSIYARTESTARSTTVQEGFAFSYTRFEPSALWRDNLARLETEAARGNLVVNYHYATAVTTHPEMWMIAAAATNAGFQPALFDLAQALCTTQNNCSLQFYFKAGNPAASIENPTTSHLQTYLSVVEPVSESQVRYLITHEFLHKIFSKVARAAGVPRFAQSIVQIAGESGRADWKAAAQHYLAMYWKHYQGPMHATNGQDQRARQFFKAITYMVEEAAEVDLITIVAPQFLPQSTAHTRRRNKDAKTLTARDYHRQLVETGDVLTNVAYEAGHLARASRAGLDVTVWQHKVEQALVTNQDAAALFHTMLTICEVAATVVSSPSFHQQYIVSADMPNMIPTQ